MVDEKGHLCWQAISNSDRVQIIIQAVEFIDNLWTKCDCDSKILQYLYETLRCHFLLSSVSFSVYCFKKSFFSP